MKRIKVLALLVLVGLLLGCSLSFPKFLDDPRFDGVFQNGEILPIDPAVGYSEDYVFIEITFDRTTVASFYKETSIKNINHESATHGVLRERIDFEASKLSYKWKVWGAPYSRWSLRRTYEFANGGDTLILHHFPDGSSGALILTRVPSWYPSR